PVAASGCTTPRNQQCKGEFPGFGPKAVIEPCGRAGPAPETDRCVTLAQGAGESAADCRQSGHAVDIKPYPAGRLVHRLFLLHEEGELPPRVAVCEELMARLLGEHLEVLHGAGIGRIDLQDLAARKLR